MELITLCEHFWACRKSIFKSKKYDKNICFSPVHPKNVVGDLPVLVDVNAVHHDEQQIKPKYNNG